MALDIPYRPLRIRKVGNQKDNQKMCWHAIKSVHAILIDPMSNRSTILRASQILAKLTHTYRDILVGTEFEQRLADVEKQLKEFKKE